MSSIQKLLVVFSITCLNFNLAANAQTLEKVAELNPGGSNSNPSSFTAAAGKLFFIAIDDAYQWRLYVTEGTQATTLKLGPSTVVNGSISNLVAYNGKLFFSSNDGVNGQELWTSDGTAAGTVLFKDLYPGATGSFPQAFTVTNGKLFFMGGGVDGERRLYVSDGTPAGTFIIRNNYINLFNGFADFAVMNNNIYFIGDNGTGSGYGLWKSNGTLAGTVLVQGPCNPGVFGSNYAVLNNKMYFSGFDDTNGGELWVTDGTDAGTHIVINLKTDQGGILYSGSPYALIVYNSKIYFSGGDDTHGQELFVTDGTAAGTQLVKDIIPGATGSNPSQIVIKDGLMYMICQGNQELWKSDGTGPGTQLVKQVDQYSRIVAVWKSKMYMVSNQNQYLSQSDGTTAGTGFATAANTPGIISISLAGDQNLTEYNSSLYFGGSCANISNSIEPIKLVPAIIIHNFSFTGSGNWSNPANWAGGIVPPTTLTSGDNIIINGNCILDIAVIAKAGSSITVAAGKSLVINGSLTVQ